MDLAGLELAELEALPRSSSARPRFHARQVFAWIWKRGVTDFAAHDRPQPRPCAPGWPRRSTIATPGVDPQGRLEDGTQKFLLELADGTPIESGLHPGHAGADVLHLDAGRLRDGLRVLPDRQDGPDPAPDRRRDRRPGPRARARLDLADDAVQHRADGHGRAAAQLRRDDEGAAHHRRRRPASPSGRGASRCRRSAWCRARAAGTRAAHAEPRDLAARHARRAARRARAARTASTRSRS